MGVTEDNGRHRLADSFKVPISQPVFEDSLLLAALGIFERLHACTMILSRSQVLDLLNAQAKPRAFTNGQHDEITDATPSTMLTTVSAEPQHMQSEAFEADAQDVNEPRESHGAYFCRSGSERLERCAPRELLLGRCLGPRPSPAPSSFLASSARRARASRTTAPAFFETRIDDYVFIVGLA